MGHPPQIPLTPQTDERNFPRHQYNAPPGQSGSFYPKMLTRPFTKEEVGPWEKKHVQYDKTSREEYFLERRPKVGDPVPVLATQQLVDEGLVPLAGEPVICRDAEHEKAIRRALGLALEEVPVPSVSIPIKGMSEEQRLIAENDVLQKLIAQNEALQKRIAAMEGDKEPAKATRKRRKRRTVPAPRSVSAAQFTGEE